MTFKDESNIFIEITNSYWNNENEIIEWKLIEIKRKNNETWIFNSANKLYHYLFK